MVPPVDRQCPSPTESIAPEENGQLLFEFHEQHYDQKPLKTLTISGLLLLTCPSLGLQVCWFLLQSSGTPYLRSLGMESPSISLAWALGPIFGAFVQPALGHISDEAHHALCRRKPFMVAGAGAVILSTLAMAYAQFLTAPLSAGTLAVPWQSRALAVVCLVITLLALSVYSIGVRAIVVDNCPTSQQSAAAAWSMRWSVLGSAALSTAGYVAAKRYPETDPAVAFRTLACVAGLCSTLTVGLVCWFAPREARPRGSSCSQGLGMSTVLATFLPAELVRRWRRLPPLTKRVCDIQFVAWCGWFPVLYYMSTYAYETALFGLSDFPTEKLGSATSPLAHAKVYPLYASLFFSFGTLVSTVLLTLVTSSSRVRIALPRLWFTSQLLAASTLFLTIPFRTAQSSLVLISLFGATWAVTMWVPFALINTELAELRTGVAGAQGLHNMAISLPQIASALACAVVLAALNLLGVQAGTVWLLRLSVFPLAWSAWWIGDLEGA